MSSFLGHALAGFTAYRCCRYGKHPSPRWAAIPFIGVAMAPDLDYLAVWLFGYAANPRISHSLVVALAAVAIVHRMTTEKGWARLPFSGLLAAGVSHALLDFLVGAHPVPLFWPFDAGVTSPVGVLPSAGALAFGNVYLWRNLLIELGVLLPVSALLIALCRGCPARRVLKRALLVAPVWMVFVGWSVALSR